MKLADAFLLLTATIAVSSCTTVPSFTLGTKVNESPTVATLVTHIQCEIWKVEQGAGLPKLKAENYVAFAQLTVDVTNFQGTAPQLNYINPYLVAMTNFTATLGGQYAGTQHRNMSQSFTVDLGKPLPDAETICGGKDKDRPEGPQLNGDLGLEAVIRDGLAEADDQDFKIFPLLSPSKTPITGNVATTNIPVFGSTVDFTVVYGVNNVGPTWTIKHFKGPGGGTGGGGGTSSGAGAGGGSAQGLLTLNRTLKDTLVISFAPTRPSVKTPEHILEVTPEIAAAEHRTIDAVLHLHVSILRLMAQVNALQLPARATVRLRVTVLSSQ